MKAYLINMHLLVPRPRSSAKVKIKYKGYISQKMTVSGEFVFHKHILFLWERVNSLPNDKMMDWIKSKAFRDNKFYITLLLILDR